jgi:hypothetical protein
MQAGELDTRTYSSDRYTLRLLPDRPFALLSDPQGGTIAELFLLSSVHSTSGLDDTTESGDWQRFDDGDTTTFSARVKSSLWESKSYRLRCSPDRISYEIDVEGRGSLTDVHYFGGYTSAFPRWGSGFFPSGQNFTRVFNPELNTDDKNYFSPVAGAVIDLTGAPLPGKRHWFFNPPPFAFSTEYEGGWLTFGVEAAPGENRFSEYRYHGQDAFWLSLTYEGRTRVDGSYSLPAIGIDFTENEHAGLRAHVGSLHGKGAAPRLGRHKADWWTRPMFCGWGAQCGRAGDEHGRRDPAMFLDSMAFAKDYCRQAEYDSFLEALERHSVRPGTVVLDDKWQLTYGRNEVDEGKWPDLRAFVDRLHGRGQHVLLWLKAWDREGVPDEECITNGAGLPLSVDPTNPAFEARLRASVRQMLGSNGYDADGFKIDFTHRIPAGPSVHMAGDSWGLELMKIYLGIIYDEAKKTKPDSLVMTHTPHPYLADVTDMIRLNDMLDLTRLDDPDAGMDIGLTLSLRASVARLACPDALIDTDNWPVRNKAVWRDYLRLQPEIGVPSLYFATQVDLTGEPLTDDDYALIREAWNGINTAGSIR